MGKSIRSKIKKRLRTVKRQRVDAMIVRPQVQEHYDSLMRVVEGRSVRLSTPKNAFKYPDEEGAVFAQHEIFKPIDFRASHLPMAGYTYRGNRRKYKGEEENFMDNLAKTSHPKEEVMAGGGCILAKTGQRISKKEAEVLATAAERPEAAATYMAGPSSASLAVAAAVAEEAAVAESEPVPESDEDRPGKVESDHLRRPVLTVTRSNAQTNRPRSNAVKKKTASKAVPKAAASSAAGGKKAKVKAVTMQTD